MKAVEPLGGQAAVRRGLLVKWGEYRRRRACDPMPAVIWSPMTILLSLGRTVLLTRTGPNTALTLPYGFGSVVVESVPT